MKKLINRPDRYVDEALGGLCATFPGVYRRYRERNRIIARAQDKPHGKVGVISGGGFGHLPLFAGYVGEGLLDARAVGEVFAGPALDDVLETHRAADRGAGVLRLVGNYGGDKMSFEMAADMLKDEGLTTATVIINDDIASAEPSEAAKRRGIAGLVYVFKIAGAAAEAGRPLQACADIAQRACGMTRTVGVAPSSCTIPTAGKAGFDLPDNQIEFGMGIHGERGVWRGALKPADAIVDEMLDRLLADLAPVRGDGVSVPCNSLGATPLEELLILYRRVAERLYAAGLRIIDPVIGHLVTSMEMAGASLSLIKLDDELLSLLRAPSHCPFWGHR
jgi:dihydroxyacetone kinase-like protein